MSGSSFLARTAARRARAARRAQREAPFLAPVTPIDPEAGEFLDVVRTHLAAVSPALASLEASADRLASWGATLAQRLVAGHRLLAGGNGGSAAEAQHLTAEIVGRFDGEREPFSAIALHAESSALTAIANDYGYAEAYARQVRGHGREGDVLLLFSTSGRSPNLLRAAEVGAELGLTTWSLTGPAPNPLAAATHEHVAIDGPSATAQECHLIALHAVCRAFDAAVAALREDEPVAEGGA